MKKSYLCLLSFATSIIALTESINKNNLFSYMMLIISIIFLFLYDNVFYRNLRFNKGDIKSLIIQLPIMLLISCLLEIDLLVITLVCFISLKVSIEIKSMDKDDCIYYLKVIFIGFIILFAILLTSLIMNIKHDYSILLYIVLCFELFIPFVLSFIGYNFS